MTMTQLLMVLAAVVALQTPGLVAVVQGK